MTVNVQSYFDPDAQHNAHDAQIPTPATHEAAIAPHYCGC
jgi:hypothetical protein